MKKILFTILLAISGLFATTVYAQESAVPQQQSQQKQQQKVKRVRNYKILGLGAKVGVNTASLSNLQDFKEAWRAGYNIGGFVELRPFRLLSLNVEALYSKKGYSISTTGDESSTSIDAVLGTIDIPIMLKWYMIGGLSVQLGVTPSFTVHSSVSSSSGSVIEPLSFKESTLSIPVGFGYTFRWGLVFDFRYNIGATCAAFTIPQSLLGSFEQGRLSSFTILMGWRF